MTHTKGRPTIPIGLFTKLRSAHSLKQFLPTPTCKVMSRYGKSKAPSWIHRRSSIPWHQSSSRKAHQSERTPYRKGSAQRPKQFSLPRVEGYSKSKKTLSESIQHNILSLCRDTYSKAKDETVSIKSACPTVTVPGFRKQPPPRNLQPISELMCRELGLY